MYNVGLDDRIEQARKAKATLETLQDQAASLPELEKQKVQEERERRAQLQLQDARQSVATDLSDVAVQIQAFKHDFAELQQLAETCAQHLSFSQRQIQNAQAVMHRAADAFESVKVKQLTGKRGADARAIGELKTASSRLYAREWASAGGGNLALAMFDDLYPRLANDLADAIRGEAGVMLLYHPRTG